MKKVFASIVFLTIPFFTYSQYNTISPAGAFLGITPSTRAASMADVGAAALAIDPSAAFWNPGKLIMVKNYSGISISHAPWMQSLYKGMSLTSVYGYFNGLSTDNNNARQIFGGGFRYFSKGDFQSTDENGNELSSHRPADFAIDFNYSRELKPGKGLGFSARIISSSLGDSQIKTDTTTTRKALGFAIDIGYFNNRQIGQNGKNSLSYGISIQNIGPKLKYSKTGLGHNIPTNLKIGGNYQIGNEPSEIIYSFSLDINKLLVPTPPLYNEDGEIIKGKNPNVSVLSGMVNSFIDAPGGISEELKEIQGSVGFEVAMKDKIFLRTGLSLESEYKGNRKYATLGAGYKAFLATNQVTFDLGYLFAFDATSPLKNSFRLSISVFIDKNK